MQTVISGIAFFYTGTFEDIEAKALRIKSDRENNVKTVPVKMIDFANLSIVEKSETGYLLHKVSVSPTFLSDAAALHEKRVQVIAEVKETNYNGKVGMKMNFTSGSVQAAK